MAETPAFGTLYLLGAIVAVAIVFGAVVRNDFVNWDDQHTLYENPDLHPPNVENLGRYWRKPAIEIYIPVTYTYWFALAKVAYNPATHSLNPGVFHAGSVALHALSACVLFALLRELRFPKRASYFATLIFALHPMQVEAVAWTSGAKDLLAGLFSLVALWLYVKSSIASAAVRLLPAKRDDDGVEPKRAPTHAALWLLLATLSYAIAMLAKPSAMALPVVAIVIDTVILRRPLRKIVLPMTIWIAMAIPIAIVAKLSQPALFVESAPLWARPVVAFDALAFYLAKLLGPVNLAPDYGRAPDAILPPTMTAAGLWALLAAYLVFAFIFYKRTRWPLAVFAISTAAMLPVLGFVRFDFQKYSTVADHYVYVAMLGPALLVAEILRTANRRWLYTSAAVAALLCGGRSFFQIGYWRNTETIFKHTLAVNEKSLAAHSTLAFLATQRGQTSVALDQYADALHWHPDDPTCNFNLANVLRANGAPDRAIPHYQRAIEHAPRASQPAMLNNLGVAFVAVGKLDLAEQQFLAALAIDPAYMPAQQSLAKLQSVKTTQPTH